MAAAVSDASPSAAPSAGGYGQVRARVDAARQRLQAVLDDPHPNADVRSALQELAAALRDARVAAGRGLQEAQESASGGRRRRPRRHATRELAPAVRPWAAELVRLAEISAWMRAVTADELEVSAPSPVRITSRAASGPHIAGLEAALPE